MFILLDNAYLKIHFLQLRECVSAQLVCLFQMFVKHPILVKTQSKYYNLVRKKGPRNARVFN